MGALNIKVPLWRDSTSAMWRLPTVIEYDIMGGINNVHKIGFAYIYLATMFYLFNRDHAVRNQVNIIQLLV